MGKGKWVEVRGKGEGVRVTCVFVRAYFFYLLFFIASRISNRSIIFRSREY